MTPKCVSSVDLLLSSIHSYTTSLSCIKLKFSKNYSFLSLNPLTLTVTRSSHSSLLMSGAVPLPLTFILGISNWL